MAWSKVGRPCVRSPFLDPGLPRCRAAHRRRSAIDRVGTPLARRDACVPSPLCTSFMRVWNRRPDGEAVKDELTMRGELGTRHGAMLDSALFWNGWRADDRARRSVQVSLLAMDAHLANAPTRSLCAPRTIEEDH